MRRLLAAVSLSAGLVVSAAPAADACTVEGCVRGICNLARDCRPPVIGGCYKIIGGTICL